MIIINNLNTSLYVNGSCYKAPSGTRYYVYEATFNTVHLHSEIGSAIIETEYSKRYIKCFGKIMVEETAELDENGMSNIVVY